MRRCVDRTQGVLIRARGLLAVLLLVVVAAGASAPATSLAAGPTTLSSLPGGDYLAVDDANQHVFVTGLPSAAPYDTNQTVEVVNFGGSLDTTLTVPGAEGLAVYKGSLYVAGCGTPTITVFDLATLTQTGTITLQENMGYPCALAATGGRLLFDADTGTGSSNPAAFKLKDSTEVQWSDAGAVSPTFTLDPANANWVLTTSLGGTPAMSELWNIGSATPKLLDPAQSIGVGAPDSGAAVTPDGSNVFVTDGTAVQEYDLPAMTTQVETLSNRPSAMRVATTADGSFMAVGLGLPGDTPGVDIFNATRTTPIHWITLAAATGTVRALAFSADESKLFVVTQPDSGPPQLFVVDSPTLAASQLTLGATPTSAAPGETVQLQGILTLQDGASPAGAEVDITETRPDGTTVDLAPVSAGAGGIYTLPATETLSQVGTYTFSAAYAGDSAHLGSTAATTVAVATGVSQLGLHASAASVVYGHTVTLTATLTGPPAGSVVSITRNVNGVKSVAASGPVDADGVFTFVAHPASNTVFTASFAATAGYTAATSNSASVVVTPVLSGTMSTPYATRSGYRLYHYHASCASSATSCPVFTIKFAPSNPGHVVYAKVQQATSKGWETVRTLSGTLGSKSMAAIKVRYTRSTVIGPPFRLVASFPGGPRFGPATKGYWYFKITK